MTVKSLPAGQRPREKAMLKGLDSLSDEELLELLIQYGVSTMDVSSLARLLLTRFHGLAGLSKASFDQLAAKGLKKAKCLKLAAAFELGRRALKAEGAAQKLLTPEQIAWYFGRELAYAERESLKLICLNRLRMLLKEEIIVTGDMSKLGGEFIDVLSPALRAKARYVYLIHNHPSGSPLPSEQDKKTTGFFTAAFAALGLTLADHIIIAGEGFYSLAEKREERLAEPI